MKKILLIAALFFISISFGQTTKIFNDQVKFRTTPSDATPTLFLTKSVDDLLTETTFIELKNLLNLGVFLENIVEDTSPQLGGGLDLNNFDITGTGNINNTGNITTSGTLQSLDAIITNDLTLSNYTNIRDDGVSLNYLFTDASGYLQSGPLSNFDSNFVTLNTIQTITEQKTFSEIITFENDVIIETNEITTSGANIATIQDVTGILALTSDLPSGEFVGVAELKEELKKTDNVISALDVDWDLGIQYTKTLVANTTITFSNVLEGKTISLVIDGNYTLTLPTGVDVADLADYDPLKTNYIQLYCTDVSTPVFLTSLTAK